MKTGTKSKTGPPKPCFRTDNSRGMVAVFEIKCCHARYVQGRYSGEREEKQARIDLYPHINCDRHGSMPLIFVTYFDQEVLDVKTPRTQKLTKRQSILIDQYLQQIEYRKRELNAS